MVASRNLPADTRAWGSFGFYQGSRGIDVSQGCELFRDPRCADHVALGQLALGLYLYPHLRPKHGYIDEQGWNHPSEASIAQTKLQYLFWANFFGPEYVQHLGSDFFRGAPGWSIVHLGDGGILYVATESYLAWWREDQSEILEHFWARVPRLRLYRARPLPD